MLKFLNGINCILLHWPKKLTLVLHLFWLSKHEKTSLNVKYFSKIAEIYSIAKICPVCPHIFLNVFYTCHKSLLIGFVWQHIAPLPLKGTDWELTDLNAIKVNIRDPASCITELAKNKTPRTMHVFFRDNEISGEKCEKLNKQHPGPCKDSKDSEESDENNETDQGNLLRGIVNWLSVAWSVVTRSKKALEQQFQ